MKILVLAPIPFYQDRRASISLKIFLQALTAAGHELTAMVYPEGESISIPGCRLLRVRKIPLIRSGNSPFSLKNIASNIVMKKMTKRLLERESFDLIHAGTGAIAMARYFSKRFKTPYTYTMESSLPEEFCTQWPLFTLLKPFFARYERHALQASVGVLTPSQYLEQVAKNYGGSTPTLRLENISLLEPELPKYPRKDTHLGTKKDTKTLMYIGNLEPSQGIDLLLEAFSLAYLDKEKLRLILIGGSKADISRYKRKAKNLGLANGVLFTGPKPSADLACYLAQADIVVSPCIDGHTPPMKIFSYLDSGKPVLATRLQMHTQILNDTIAMLVEPVDSEMATGMVQLARDVEKRDELAAKAKERVAAEYNQQAYTQKLASFFNDLPQNTNTI